MKEDREWRDRKGHHNLMGTYHVLVTPVGAFLMLSYISFLY